MSDSFNLSMFQQRKIMHVAYTNYKRRESYGEMLLKLSCEVDRKMAVGKIVCGDPMMDLMDIASIFLPEYDEDKPIKDIIKMVEIFTYPTTPPPKETNDDR